MKLKYVMCLAIMILVLLIGSSIVRAAGYKTWFYDSNEDKWEVGESWDFNNTSIWYTSYNIFCTKAGARTPTNVTIYNRMDSSDGKTFNWANSNKSFGDDKLVKFLYVYSTLNDEIAKGDIASRKNNWETDQQQAVWEILGGQNLTNAATNYKNKNKTRINMMLSNAEAYYEFWKNNGGDVETKIDTSNVEVNNNKLGPFKLSFYEKTGIQYNNNGVNGSYGGVEKVELVSSQNLGADILCYSKGSGNVRLLSVPKPNEDLYINIEGIDITKYDSIRVTFNDGYLRDAYIILANSRKSKEQSSMFGAVSRYIIPKTEKFELEDEFTFKVVKTDEETGERLANVKFMAGHADEAVSEYITNRNGEVDIKVVVKGGKQEVYINLHEVAPDGYKSLGYGVQLVFKKENKQWTCARILRVVYNEQNSQIIYENGKNLLEGELITYIPNNPKTNDMTGILYVKNEREDSEFIKLKIYKVDLYNTSKLLDGAKFSIEVENGRLEPNKSTITVDGYTTIKIKPKDKDKDVEIIIKETEAPDGYKLNRTTIRITYSYKEDNNGNGDWKLTDKSGSSASVTGSIIRIKNESKTPPPPERDPGPGPGPGPGSTPDPTPDPDPITSVDIIEGYVYLDGYSGNKVVSEPNGKKDNDEQTVKGVIVKLSDGRTTVTDNNGYYKFTDVVRGQNYTLTFEYDGINYKATTTGEGSQATEVDRNGFNNKFKTINYGQSSAGIGLNYWAYGDNSNWNPKYNEKPGWLLKSLNENHEIMNNDYKMMATTEFKLENDVQYDYKWDERVHSHSSDGDGNTECNCYWGASGQDWFDTTKNDTTNGGCDSGIDYDLQGTNYYIKGGTTQTRENPDFWYYHESKHTSEDMRNNTVTYNLNFGLVKREVDLSAVNDLKEVKVSVNGKITTYNYEEIPVTGDVVNIGNVSSDEVKNYILELDEKDYLYGSAGNNYADSNVQELQQYSEENKLKIEATYKVVLNNQSNTKSTINSIVYYYDANYKLNGVSKGTVSEATSVTIDGKNYNKVDITGLNITLEEGAQATLEVYLEINARGDQIQKETYKTIVEITSYSTEEGKIDLDSAPGNALQGGNLVYEDDTDTAPGLKITATGTRILSGYVWDDSKKESNKYTFADGIRQENEPGIADVIAQLIEIKEVDGQKHYYLWQEVTTREDGIYEITNFVPGNYIVRFVYGSTANTANHNGQDYKSTTDLNYNNYKAGKWYNEYHTDANNTSVARDNEARRLDAIANTAEIDTVLGEALRDKTNLDDTYMYADTSKINIAVTSETGNEIVDSNRVKGNEENYYNFRAVNFGIEERPKTSIEFEKHITAFRITANDGTTIVDAELLRDENGRVIYTPNSIIKGLQSFYATRENRAKWYLATDIEEVIQGATLELRYTYTVKNTSEKDYISTILAQEFENRTSEEYKTLLNEKANEIRNDIKANDYNSNLGKYLGTTYYTGKLESDVSMVKTNIGKIEDYINNDLKFNAVNSSDFEINGEASGKEYNLLAPQKETGIWSETKETINTVVISKHNVGNMSPEDSPRTQTIILESNGKLTSTGTLDFPGYIAQIKTAYSNPMGRRDVYSIPGNLKYIDNYSLENNEPDEYWVETVEITKPTGADRQTAVTLAASIAVAITILATGIISVKKYLI